MDEQEERFEKMLAETQQTRYQYLTGELAACFDTVKRAVTALAAGNLQQAEREAAKAEEGYQAIVRFLAKIADDNQRQEVEQRWEQLRSELDALQAQLKDAAGDS